MKRSSARKIGKKAHSNRLIAFFASLVLMFVLVVAASYVLKLVRARLLVCANSRSCINDLSGTKQPDTEGIFLGKTVAVPQTSLDQTDTQILGENAPAANKRIDVDLAKQTLYAYEDDKLVYEFLVSTGKWGRTPTGEFRIWIKLRYTRMSGGNSALGTYYDLPNVPYVMFFYNDEVSKATGYSIHGTYWHNNFGHTMSHGCVNMRTEDVKKLYYWANPVSTGSTTYESADDPGTLIRIYGTPPLD